MQAWGLGQGRPAGSSRVWPGLVSLLCQVRCPLLDWGSINERGIPPLPLISRVNLDKLWCPLPIRILTCKIETLLFQLRCKALAIVAS